MGRTALVTGGTGGLGSAVTTALLADGWRVVVPWVAEEELSRLERVDGLELVRADLFSAEHAARCRATTRGGQPGRWLRNGAQDARGSG